MFDIVHERCSKFNTRRMARMGILYYTIDNIYSAEYILSMTILTANITGTILFIKQNKIKKIQIKNKKRTVSYAGTSHKVGMV